MGRIEEAIAKATRIRAQGGKRILSDSCVEHPNTRPLMQEAAQSRSVDCPFVFTANGRKTAISEEYKKLKSSVLKLTRGDQFRNVIMVTSALPGEGKSITSINLAITLSQEYDVRAILVDMDFRKPSINSYLKMNPKKGLSDCLIDGSDLGEAIVNTGISRLTFMPAGRTVENPVEMFSSRRMGDIIEELRARYHDRYVIIDSPPVLPIAETRILGHLVDAVILVVSEDLASRKQIEETMSHLKGIRILGVVYNMASLVGLNGSYRRYGHYYGPASQTPEGKQ